MANNSKKSFPTPRPAPQELSETSSALECFDFYRERQGLTESQVCVAAGINQPWCNRVLRGKVVTTDIEKLVTICLILRLSPTETIDFLSRLERALSPANPAHRAYMELLVICSEEKCLNDMGEGVTDPISYANAYLRECGFPELPAYR